MLTTREVVASARYAMVDGNLNRAPVSARVVGQWLDIIGKSLDPDSRQRIDLWCDGWFKSQAPQGLRMGYSFRVVLSGTALPVRRGRLHVSYREYKSQPVNVAEYYALIRALKWAKEKDLRGEIIVHTDSQTVWGQITQAWNTNAHKFPQIGRLWAEASQLLDEVDGRLVKEPRLSVKAMLGH